MVNKKGIERVVSEAEQSFKDCWRKLLLMRNGGGNHAEMLAAVVTFQPTLGTALYKLESFNNVICKEGRDLNGRKSLLNRKWLHQRYHVLNGYKKLIKSAVDVGKMLGDSFAWIFYQHDRELLRKHFEHESNPHPTGIGGRGEIEFVRRFPKFGDYFVVAHSTTTFLRLGDISLIDPDEMKTAGIGELKTKTDGESRLVISVNLVGRKLMSDKLPSITQDCQPAMPSGHTSLPPQLLERLRKQITTIREAFNPKKTGRALPSSKIGVTYTCSKLEELYDRSSLGRWGHVKADRGLLLVGMSLTRAAHHHEDPTAGTTMGVLPP